MHAELASPTAKEPGAQALHELAPDELKRPAAHSEHSATPALLKRPGAHVTQSDEFELPTTELAEPVGHRSQEEAPELVANEPIAHDVQDSARAALNEPGTHDEHDDAPEPAKAPGRHSTHACSVVLPVSALDVPAGQSVQDSVSLFTANEPWAQSVHTLEPRGAKLPAGHALHVGAPSPLARPTAHDTHAVSEVLPALAFDVPAGQSVQVGVAGKSAYEPGEHDVQASAPEPL